MQKDFHYYCIAVLAKEAGFEIGDALTIAYASQYVDDSTECGSIEIAGSSGKEVPIVRTAHKGIKQVLQFFESARTEVLRPFHFIPPVPSSLSDDSFKFVTSADSVFARDILYDAIQEKDKTLHLSRIGMALHTYADTWAHQGFSGRQDDENEVIIDQCSDEVLFTSDLKYHTTLTKNHSFLGIGHLLAGTCPDLPYLTWGYRYRVSMKKVDRENYEIFILACRRIYGYLRYALSGKEDEELSEDTSSRIHGLFMDQPSAEDDRCEKWIAEFRDLFRDSQAIYKEDTWKREAFVHDFNRDTFPTKDLLSVPEAYFGEDQNEINWTALDDKWNELCLKVFREKERVIQGEAVKNIPERTKDLLDNTQIILGLVKLVPQYRTTKWYAFQRAAEIQRDLIIPKIPPENG